MSIKTLGLHHVALNVIELEACAKFYIEFFSMKIEWQPDDDNIYLTSGNDNLALHRAKKVARDCAQRLDHIGFMMQTLENIFKAICNKIAYYRDKLKVEIPFWNIIIKNAQCIEYIFFL